MFPMINPRLTDGGLNPDKPRCLPPPGAEEGTRHPGRHQELASLGALAASRLT